MRVLITGAAGFLGRHVVRRALDRGHTVSGVDSFSTSDPDDLRVARESWAAPIEFEAMDVRSEGFVAWALDFQPELIFHLACPTGVPNLVPLAEEMLTTSFDGTRNVLAVAERCGSRVAVASSAEVYGDPLVTPQAESYTGNVDTLGPRKGYEEGKRVAETLCAIAAEARGVQGSIARIFNTYGPGMSLDDTRVVPAFARAALEGRDLEVHGEGAQVRCHCYVEDTVEGLWLIAERGVAGRAYNLGTSEQHSVRELAERIRALAGSTSRIVTVARPSHDHQSRLPETARIRDELGWKPRVDLDTGLSNTILDFGERLGHSR